MSRVLVHGVGAVSPAGWGAPALCAALAAGEPLPIGTLARPGWDHPLAVRGVPAPEVRPAFLAHPRLRRSSIFAQHIVAAALEALGADAERAQRGELRLGIIVGTMAGCVNYSRRFYEETLSDPRTASPLLFPETVFNAPASHLAAYLNVTGLNYTLVGDEGAFVQGLAVAAQWLTQGTVEGCVVLGGEELDWIGADALRHFSRRAVYAAGTGALYLRRNHGPSALAELAAITDVFSFTKLQDRARAVKQMKAQLLTTNAPDELFEVRNVLGEAYNAAAAWQCVAACCALRDRTLPIANLGIVGANQQAVGVRFAHTNGA